HQDRSSFTPSFFYLMQYYIISYFLKKFTFINTEVEIAGADRGVGAEKYRYRGVVSVDNYLRKE
uniref:hypothetical protein n=1 Tax=Ruminococcus bicirculans (ex Wegman et al. 2014) TaxID=1160721 RepID=UPI003FD88D8E